MQNYVNKINKILNSLKKYQGKAYSHEVLQIREAAQLLLKQIEECKLKERDILSILEIIESSHSLIKDKL